MSISTAILRELIAAGSVTALSATGAPGGFYLSAQVGLERRLLDTQRGGPRLFKRLDALASFVHGVGLSKFEVDIAQWGAADLVPGKRR